MFRIFHSNFPFSNFLLPLLAIPLIIPFWGLSTISFPEKSVFILNLTIGNSMVNRLLAVLLLCIQAVYLNTIINTSEIYNRNSYLSGFLYVLIALPHVLIYGVNFMLIGQFFCLMAVQLCFQIYRNKPSKELVFWASCSLGLGAIFYLPFLALSPSILIFLSFIRPFKWREYALSLIGAPLIIMITYSLYYIFSDHLPWEVLSRKNLLEGPYVVKNYVLTAIALLTLIATVSLIQNLNLFSIRGRKLVQSNILFCLPLILWSIVLVLTGQGPYFLPVAFGLSVLIFSWYLHSKIKWMAELISYSIYFSYLLWFWGIL